MSELRTPWLKAGVVGLRDLSPTVRELTLRPDGGAIGWSVGSHLRVQVVHADGRLDERCYSLVGLPGPGADWRIAVKRAEPSRGGSAFMWRLAVGDALTLQAPANHFELPPTPLPTLLLAGGIGITPVYGMALALAARRADVRMVYAARSDDELVYGAELQAALGPRLSTRVDGRGGRLDVEAEIAALAPEGQLLVCGPVPLLHAVQAAWAAAGRAPQRLRFETFGNTGALPTEPFWVELPRHGMRFEVPADRSLLEMLESHGVPCLADCLRGECGLCAVEVLEVQGRIDHRDVFFSAAEKSGNQRLCACVSRACGGGLVIDSAWRPDTLPSLETP
jgi:vanillate monooxygenase ferredoxin subunit